MMIRNRVPVAILAGLTIAASACRHPEAEMPVAAEGGFTEDTMWQQRPGGGIGGAGPGKGEFGPTGTGAAAVRPPAAEPDTL